MKTAWLVDLCEVIRSKNSGPYELTLDMVFRRPADYERAKTSGFFTKKLFARLYSTTPERILAVIFFDPACAVKVTLVRPLVSGDPGETDVYGAQQHAPLLGIEVPRQS
jgi:hypothetical protein